MPAFAAETYSQRRNELRSRLDSGLAVLPGHGVAWRNADNPFPFRQSSHLLYLAPIKRPGLILVMDVDSGEDILFGPPEDPDDEVWHGPHATLSEDAERVGISQVRGLDQFGPMLQQAVSAGRQLHLPPLFEAGSRLALEVGLAGTGTAADDLVSPGLVRALGEMRLRKSEEEVREIDSALSITATMFERAFEAAQPGRSEAEVRAAMAQEVLSRDVQFSFAPIVTINGEILHNHSYGNAIGEGDLLLVDAGIEVASGYCSDITRTIPVTGSFDSRQRAIYEIVEQARAETIAAGGPGVNFRDLHDKASLIIAEGLVGLGLMRGDSREAVSQGAHALFFVHGLGHPLGLDVHDLHDIGDAVAYPSDRPRAPEFGTRFLRFGRDLEEGMVMTIEPGIYFIPSLISEWRRAGRFERFIDYAEVEKYLDFGGIRIEDDVICTTDGLRVLGPGIPSDADAVQEVLARRSIPALD